MFCTKPAGHRRKPVRYDSGPFQHVIRASPRWGRHQSEDNVVGPQLAVDLPAAGTVIARRQRASRFYWLCFASVRSAKGTGSGASISGAQSRKRAWRWGDFRRIRVLHAVGESHVADFCALQQSFLALHKSSQSQGVTQNRRRRSGTPLVARKRPISEGALITPFVGLGRSGQLAQATPVSAFPSARWVASAGLVAEAQARLVEGQFPAWWTRPLGPPLQRRCLPRRFMPHARQRRRMDQHRRKLRWSWRPWISLSTCHLLRQMSATGFCRADACAAALRYWTASLALP